MTEKRYKNLEVPADLLDRVTSLGKANRRSANAEIVVAIEERLEREEKAEPRRSKR
jgi:predicted transcriptional regulator